VETLDTLTQRYNKARKREFTRLQMLELVVRFPQLVVMVADGRIDNIERERISSFATDLYDGIFYVETEEDKERVTQMVGNTNREALLKSFSEELNYLSENLKEWEHGFLSALRKHIEDGADPLVRRSHIIRKLSEAAFTSDINYLDDVEGDLDDDYFLQSTLEAIKALGVVALDSRTISPNTSLTEKQAIVNVARKLGAKPFDAVPIFAGLYQKHLLNSGLNLYRIQYVETYEWITSRRKSSYDGNLTLAGYHLKLTNASARAYIESTMRQNIGDIYSVKILSVVPLTA
jgi:hypothetical protein